MHLQLEFSGGMELLFEQQREIAVELSESDNVKTIRDLLPWIRRELLKERPELFMQEDTVRPGILVLINDADWELEGELEYTLCDKDRITFISTLHGG
ncbi:ubiquitin-related modifier 1 [Syncephalis plumigaleata]|nr:ubiquitin-related modifier 1 [Syncephalis plumigaleata]